MIFNADFNTTRLKGITFATHKTDLDTSSFLCD